MTPVLEHNDFKFNVAVNSVSMSPFHITCSNILIGLKKSAFLVSQACSFPEKLKASYNVCTIL